MTCAASDFEKRNTIPNHTQQRVIASMFFRFMSVNEYFFDAKAKR